MMLGAAEAAEIQESLGRAIEHHAHAVEQVDDSRRGFTHPLYRGLIGQEVAAIDSVVEVDVGRVALALGVNRAVDSALRADRVRTLDRNDREQIDLLPGLRELHRGRQTGEPATDNDVMSRHTLLFS